MACALHVFPESSAPAAENMALDGLLLDAAPDPAAIRFRHYGWTEPACTFGYAQHWAEVARRVPAGVVAIRRPTGGGVVDHRADWTYALAFPAGHPAAQGSPGDLYRLVHRSLAAALRALGQPADLAPAARPHPTRPAGLAAACFTAPEPDDVIAPGGRKIAGAALKRTRAGVLWQGSLERRAAATLRDWPGLERAMVEALAESLGARAEPRTAPEYPAAAYRAAVERFASAAWNHRR